MLATDSLCIISADRLFAWDTEEETMLIGEYGLILATEPEQARSTCLDFGEGEGEDFGADCEHDDGPAIRVRDV